MEFHVIACGIKIIHMAVLIHNYSIQLGIYRLVALIDPLPLYLQARQIEPKAVCIQGKLNGIFTFI
ncbi:hypothetical protein D3C73_1157750 [compost metagenome]